MAALAPVIALQILDERIRPHLPWLEALADTNAAGSGRARRCGRASRLPATHSNDRTRTAISEGPLSQRERCRAKSPAVRAMADANNRTTPFHPNPI